MSPRPPIPPVTVGEPRPLWSVMIPTHNCASYLRRTLETVLAQDPGPDHMQIAVVDDHSSADDPEAVVRELGHGRVDFFRQPENVGHTRNFNTCLARSRGHLVHLLHGDDGVLPEFYRVMGHAFDDPAVGAAFCRVVVMREDGNWDYLKPLAQASPGLLQDRLRSIAVDQPILTPSIVVRRSVYEDLGGFDTRFRACGEDFEMWFRIAAHYPVWYEPRPLALYRTHQASLTGRAIRTGLNVRETRMAVESFRPYLTEADRDDVIEAAMRRVAFWALQLSQEALMSGDLRTAVTQAEEALRCNSSPSVLLRSVRVGVSGLRRLARPIRKAPPQSLRRSTSPDALPY